ncbi:MAG TPA: hypothetical protein VFL72_05545 [Acidimicrobiia bacterium]|nr:hypothetical protein [Acidimicrobiia bacterium]
MGFKKESTIFKLEFEDPAYSGLEVLAKSVPTGDFLDLMDAAAKMDLTSKTFSPDDLKAVKILIEGFGRALVSWNLEDDDDEPVPATIEGVRGQELPFLLPIVTSWMDAVAGVSADLGKESSSGETSPEVAIPMAPL